MSNIKTQKITAIAPGRVCLFGDHQDYLGLPIIACAINRFVKIEGTENHKGVFNFSLPDINQKFSIDYKTPIDNLNEGDHFRSALKVLKGYNSIPNRGFDIRITGDIPINAGLSSSSAVVVAWVKFLIEAYGIDSKMTPELIAQIAYEAEVVEMNSSGGKMDQYTIAIGNIIYLETNKNSKFETLKPKSMCLVVCESGVPKATLGVLKELKSNSWEAINCVKQHFEDFKIETAKISDIPKYLEHVPKELQVYLSAAIKNHDITQRALKELKSDSFKLKNLGNLMNAHHSILKDDLDLTVPKIDAMIKAAKETGALGAKIVGSGKGGSIVALCTPENEDRIIGAIKKAGAKDAYKVSIQSGAYILKNKAENAQ